jgi:adenylate cyclase
MEGDLPPRNEAEQALADKLGLPPEVRLSCQLPAAQRMRVRRVVRDPLDTTLLEQSNQSREMNVAILFSDVRGFTQFAGRHLSYDVVHILNRYFWAMGRCVEAHHGRVDKYIGDGLMAVFGMDGAADPVPSAVAAARDMLRELAEFNAYLETAFHERFEIGIGIHYGSVVVGRIGHPATASLTVIGDNVNVAARVESATKETATVLLSADAYALCGETGWREFVVQLKGKEGSARAYGMP